MPTFEEVCPLLLLIIIVEDVCTEKRKQVNLTGFL